MKLTNWLLGAHAAATLFAIAGLLIAIPNPQLWAGAPFAPAIYSFGMAYGGVLHIVLGAALMFCFGVLVLGWWRTTVFFVLSTCLSLCMELLGTGTGWPFGAYEYTAGLGYKILGEVPFSVPLSWFYMGLSCYLLGWLILERAGVSRRACEWGAVALGAWLLTAWDLVLDPAMAHESLPIQFWVWHETGPYMGMPLVNFAGWAMTGVLFMALSRLCWRRAPETARIPVALPFSVYLVNVVFAVALSASISLWLPIVLALLLGVGPTLLVWRRPMQLALRAPAAI